MRLVDISELSTAPLRLKGPSPSPCCAWPSLLVRSMDGGFVTRNCMKCWRPTTLSNYDFFYRLSCVVACPECGQEMYREFIDKNYGFVCHDCDLGIQLADVVPRWNDARPRAVRLMHTQGEL